MYIHIVTILSLSLSLYIYIYIVTTLTRLSILSVFVCCHHVGSPGGDRSPSKGRVQCRCVQPLNSSGLYWMSCGLAMEGKQRKGQGKGRARAAPGKGGGGREQSTER